METEEGEPALFQRSRLVLCILFLRFSLPPILEQYLVFFLFLMLLLFYYFTIELGSQAVLGLRLLLQLPKRQRLQLSLLYQAQHFFFPFEFSHKKL